jgi:hypothetical protein
MWNKNKKRSNRKRKGEHVGREVKKEGMIKGQRRGK